MRGKTRKGESEIVGDVGREGKRESACEEGVGWEEGKGHGREDV